MTANVPNQNTPEVAKEKPTQVNKYSIYELKSGIDTAIIDFLDKKEFQENYTNAITKIILGLFCLTFTGFAYLYPKPFPENYYLVMVCVIGYFLFSGIYWLFETYSVKNTFYVGNNVAYLEKSVGRKAQNIKNFKLNSEVKPHSGIYDLWIDVITRDGRKFGGEKQHLECARYYDERGFINKEEVTQHFNQLLLNTIRGLAI